VSDIDADFFFFFFLRIRKYSVDPWTLMTVNYTPSGSKVSEFLDDWDTPIALVFTPASLVKGCTVAFESRRNDPQTFDVTLEYGLHKGKVESKGTMYLAPGAALRGVSFLAILGNEISIFKLHLESKNDISIAEGFHLKHSPQFVFGSRIRLGFWSVLLIEMTILTQYLPQICW
jgi:hypothetical protein